jgi:hypothetical protein
VVLVKKFGESSGEVGCIHEYKKGKNTNKTDLLAARKDGLSGSDVAIEASFVQHSIGKDDVALAIEDISFPGSEACRAGGRAIHSGKMIHRVVL